MTMTNARMGEIALDYSMQHALEYALQHGGRRQTEEELMFLAPELADRLAISEIEALEFLRCINRY